MFTGPLDKLPAPVQIHCPWFKGIMPYVDIPTYQTAGWWAQIGQIVHDCVCPRLSVHIENVAAIYTDP
ncbi:predicted protein [Histoplasma mississippiense (nom. inval.)]|uniref:predicted protein n=1 Tax=Ajellomyces capsulatus (strain NAm1 / WU24) TaxID=2059318 RepID=UPI000157D35A|nr:predicted protein [Histoplasma mississippiense (nom. inval.)]EDN04667.1 predicted protein [Histoplasma mississippiense (nom. inval.)]